MKLSSSLLFFLLALGTPAAKGGLDDAYNSVKTRLALLYNTVFASGQSQCVRKSLQECTCFEVLQVNSFRVKGQPLDKGDIKKGYRVASKFYHADKGGSDEEFLFLGACFSKLNTPILLQEYTAHIEKLERRKVDGNWGEEKFRDRIDQLNEMFLNSGPKTQYTTRTPPAGMNDTDVDRMFLFLDDSYSMQGEPLSIGHTALKSIEDRIERTPTSVHFIGSSSFLKFRFEDSPTVADVLPNWLGHSGYTQLWEYIFLALQRDQKPNAPKKDEVVIITDGHDNVSGGDFASIAGYNHLMTELKGLGMELRISVLCIGSEHMCKGADYRDLAMATGGVYEQVDTQDTTEDRDKKMLSFTNHISSSNAARDTFEKEARLDYEKGCIAGTTKELSWYTPLKEESTLKANAAQQQMSGSSYFRSFDL